LATRLSLAARIAAPLARSALGFVLAAAVAGCGVAAQVVEPPPPSAAPSFAPSAALEALRTQVETALEAASIQAEDARVPFRPGESPLVAAAPRVVVHAIIPAAPDRGFVVLYDFADPSAAVAAAKELAGYLASGPGRVQFAPDERFTIRQVGAGLVFYSWSPGSSAAPTDEERIATVLGALGQGFAVQG
jgi:hypothetical protein